jgi:hypothetical protein
MPVFYYHPQNVIAQRLQEMTGQRGFLYTNRSELELKLQKQLTEAGYDIWSTCHGVIGSLAGSIDLHIPLNPDDELDRHTLKLCKTKTPWCFFRIVNGPKMSCVLGYCSTGAHSPFAMGSAEMAQKGIISSSFVPRAL